MPNIQFNVPKFTWIDRQSLIPDEVIELNKQLRDTTERYLNVLERQGKLKRVNPDKK